MNIALIQQSCTDDKFENLECGLQAAQSGRVRRQRDLLS